MKNNNKFSFDEMSNISNICFKCLSRVNLSESDIRKMQNVSKVDLLVEFFFSTTDVENIYNHLKLEENRCRNQKITFGSRNLQESKNRKKYLAECGCQAASVSINKLEPTVGSLPLMSVKPLGAAMMSSRPNVSANKNLDYHNPNEGGYVKSALQSIIDDAQFLITQLNNGDNLPEWTQEKIWTAKDRINSTREYLDNKIRFNYE